MAEINIERKERPIWPWIIGILVLLLLIWLIWRAASTDEIAPADETAVTDTIPRDTVEDERTGDAVNQYMNFVNQESPEMGREHDYTSNGIRRLADALEEIVQEQNLSGDIEINQKRQDLRNKADRIQQDATSTQHANTIRDAFTSATDLMQSIQEKNFPGLGQDVEQARQSAQAVDPGTQTLEQRDKIKQFFRDAGNVVEKMD
jgi:ABC-type nickel/cobalt efflux system permease component RcnA